MIIVIHFKRRPRDVGLVVIIIVITVSVGVLHHILITSAKIAVDVDWRIDVA